MKKTVPVNGTCPITGRIHTIYVDYIFAGNNAHGNVWIKGIFDCKQSSFLENPACQS